MKKGFTLIELLAVIVILAIIALISTPIILNVIETSKKGAAESSALGYVDAVEKAITIGKVDSNKGISIPNDNDLSLENDDDALILSKIKVKGTEPSYVSLQFEKGKVKTASFCINNYSFDYESNKIKAASDNYCTGVSKIEIENTELTLDDDSELQLNVNITAIKNDYTVRYLSSDESVATVSDTGKVTAHKAGEVTITVKAGTKSDSYTLNVVAVPKPVSFSTDSWETISESVKKGKTTKYQVGDTKPVNMGSLGIHTVRIANMTPCTNGETSETACGFVVEFADVITTHVMNSTDTNVGGWRDSAMRTYVNGTLFNSLPTDLRNIIVDTKVVSGHGSTSGETNFTTTDKLYFLSSEEVWGTNSYDTAIGTSRKLDYYANLGVTESNYSGAIKQYNGSNSYWWFRSAASYRTYNFIIAHTNGSWNFYSASYATGVSPAFRIG